ncbi:MAG: Rossmann-like and DUF2520 domain-containing protein [Saprospiraceae bacterium]
MSLKIVLIGAGNAGYHLGRHLAARGELLQVFSRTTEKAQRLSKLTGAPFTTSLDEIIPDADVYLLAIHDDGIAGVAGKLCQTGCGEKLVCHTSGATPMAVFAKTGLKRFGVFYPLQTFSVARQPDFTQIPFIIEANNARDVKLLDELAGLFSQKIYHLNDEKRAALHVAAVFVNNFTNHLFHVGKTILKHESLPFDLLLPLIRETGDKIILADPHSVQTGPAKRGDFKTITRHLNYLKQFPELRDLYDILTKSIQRTI